MKGTVRRTGGGVYRVALDDGREVEAALRGRLKLEARAGDRVVIGDRVEVEPGDDGDSWTIEAVAPRRSQVARRAPRGRGAKVVAANVDRVVVVMAAREPEPRSERIDRLLVLAEADGLPAALVVNKVDLPGAAEVAAELDGLYGPLGYPVLRTSAVTGEGLPAVETLLCSGTSALVGPSGVGKSSLLNALEPGLGLRVGELSGKIARGRHTTVNARLVPLPCGGLVADTPGFSDVGLWDVAPGALEDCFPEMRPLVDGCRFRGCSHVHEPGCAVLEAVEEGAIAHSRWESYRTLLNEAAAASDPG